MCGVYLAGGLEALSAAMYAEATATLQMDLDLDLVALLLSFFALIVLYQFW